MKEEQRKKINERQRDFYNTKKKNLATRIWSYFRNGSLNRIKKETGVEKDIYNLHKEWFGDLKWKKVLDLGCYAGNSLSMFLAENSKQYIGIDLSELGIKRLERRIGKFPNAEVKAVDFLSNEFVEKDFDLIYAYGVLHHFKDLDELIVRLDEKLSEEGIIVSHDPLKTSWPIKFIRAVYRPFQSDKEWEWPFSRTSYYKFKNAFNILERRAVLGKAKWSALLNFMPLPDSSKLEMARKWHENDWVRSADSEEYMFTCMHLSMLMQKRKND
ncbi:class I SAM-dependent methyltransferase [Christiangramia echinicola]|uniref:Methyltransferase domain-containing protein n=1 Tax=Christiangramia echinicola TaxID=279359 RepID=A0A1H1L2S1_9FLAO|nr:class I SAM-dependent methyltransferase [Christiangramia echinicola]SDR68858.1 Methyltransferase domain-containing protein [Christiangramia echinicola]